MRIAWRATVNPPENWITPSQVVVSNGSAFVHGVDGRVDAYDVAGIANCAGTPVTCSPQWTADAGGPYSAELPSVPASDGAHLFVGGGDGTLYAFDAAGSTNCDGTPRTCAPLWRADFPTGGAFRSPVVANGRIFVTNHDGQLFAFDANGVTGCGGVPVECAPLWSAAPGDPGNSADLSPAVTDSFVFTPGMHVAASGLVVHTVDAYDPLGHQGCSGTPVACLPVWQGDLGDAGGLGWPVVSGGLLYMPLDDKNAAVFDAAGAVGCTGTPTVCTPRWRLAADFLGNSFPAIGPDGTAYTAGFGLSAFSSDGVANCSGQPVYCQPLRSASTSGLSRGPALVGDIAIIAQYRGCLPATLEAIDTTTMTSLGVYPLDSSSPCHGSIPSTAAVDDGHVFVSTNGGDLQAWEPG